MIGFSLALPFAPFYIQQLGVTGPEEIKWWASACQGATGFSLAIMAPIWGTLADRYGRRPMMIRAQFCGVLVLGGMAVAPNVQTFFLLRILQGAFTGTMGAAMTLVAAIAPLQRQGIALGSMSAAHFTGFMLGPLVGGVLAEEIGYRSTFALSAVLLLAGAMMVLFFSREEFDRESARQEEQGVKRMFYGLSASIPFFILFAAMSFSRTFDGAIFPLYVQEIHGRFEGAARWTGLISGVGATGAVVSGVIFGRLADSIRPLMLGRVCAVAGAVLSAMMGLFPFFGALIPLRFCLAFFLGGLDPVFQAWISRNTPVSQRGVIFGWSATARSLGWGLAPFFSGWIAVTWNVRAIYVASPFLFLLLLPLISIVHSSTMHRRVESTET